MRRFIQILLRERLINPENEIFSAYHGRYLFNVTKAYAFIDSKQIQATVKKFSPTFLGQFSHAEFSEVDPAKIEKLRTSIDYNRPLGILVNFVNPEDNSTEWILIDGNHRVRVAAEADMSGLLYVIQNPQDVNKFMKTNNKVPHAMFADY